METFTSVFHYNFHFLGRSIFVEREIEFPLREEIDEITYEIIDKHNLLDSLFEDINEKLHDFIADEEKNCYLDLYDSAKEEDDDFSSYWTNLYSMQWSNFSSSMPSYQKTIEFTERFNELLSASRQNELIRMICFFKQDIDECYKRRSGNLVKLKKCFDDDRKSCILSNGQITEIYRNQIRQIKSKSNEHIKELMKTHRNDFHKWVDDNYCRQIEHGDVLPFSCKNGSDRTKESEKCHSFSFKFGYQLKCTHNINICLLNIASYLEISSESELYYPTLLKNMLSLYHQNLSCLILVTDGKFTSNTRVEKYLERACAKTTELHFPFLSEQLESIEDELFKNNHNFMNGDCYITIHSNLIKAQVVFHLITSSEQENYSPAIDDSQIKGLKNIIEQCSNSGINTISLPLFLIHELKPENDKKWCFNRADLMLKCLKAIILQTTPFHFTPQPFTFNLLLPDNTNEEIFNQTCQLIQFSYTSSNILNLTPYT